MIGRRPVAHRPVPSKSDRLSVKTFPSMKFFKEIQLPVTVYSKANHNMEIKLRMQITDGINFIEGKLNNPSPIKMKSI